MIAVHKQPAVLASAKITPLEQLAELSAPFVPDFANNIPESVLPSVLGRVVAEYAIEIDSRLTDWYTVLERLHMLPRYVPRLPPNIIKIMYSDCCIFKNSNGRPYKVIDSHSLKLVPGQSKSLIRTVECIQKRARKYGLADPDLYRIHTFWLKAFEKYGNKDRIVPIEWHLMTKWAIPNTDKVPRDQHAAMIAAVNRKTSLRYQTLSLQTSPFVLFFHSMATGERLLAGRPSFSYVKERAEDTPLVIGKYSEKGLMIHRGPKETDYRNVGIGSVVVLLFI